MPERSHTNSTAMILIKCLAIFSLYCLPIIVPIVAATLYLERRARRKRITRARAAFAVAYDAMKRAQYDPYPTNFPLFMEDADKAGWNLDYQKSRRCFDW